VQSLYLADLEYILDIAVAANGAKYIVTPSLTHSLQLSYLCYGRVPKFALFIDWSIDFDENKIRV